MRLHLVSFADTSLKSSKRRFLAQARAFEVFDSIRVYSQHSLPLAFKIRFRKWLRKGVRGFGYWIWKPQIIFSALKALPDGDYLVYADVGFHIRCEGRQRFDSKVELLSKSKADFIVFQAKPPEEYPPHDGRDLPDFSDARWSKGSLIDYFEMRDDPAIHEGIIEAGLIFIRNCPSSRAVIRSWLDTATSRPELIDDSPSVSPNMPGFVAHRHDQSIFSLLIKSGVEAIRHSGFEYWYPDSEQGKVDWLAIDESPFHARRDKVRTPKWGTVCRRAFRALKRKSQSHLAHLLSN